MLAAQVVGERHLKLKLAAGAGPLDAIAFGYLDGAADPALPRAGTRVQVAYRLEVNEYNGRQTVQLNCQQVKPA